MISHVGTDIQFSTCRICSTCGSFEMTRFFFMLQSHKIFLPFEFQYLTSTRNQYARNPRPARFYDDKGFFFNSFPNDTDPDILYQKNGVLHAPHETDVNRPRTRSPDSRIRRPRRSRSTGTVIEGRGRRRSGDDEFETLLGLGESASMRGRSRTVRIET